MMLRSLTSDLLLRPMMRANLVTLEHLALYACRDALNMHVNSLNGHGNFYVSTLISIMLNLLSL